MRHRALALLLGTLLAGGPAVAAPTAPKPARAAGQSWWQWAGEEAKRADALEKKGLHGEAEAAREQVLHALLLAWREEQDGRALDPIVITLQRRLGRSTAAVETALSLIYDLHRADAVGAKQQAQIDKLAATMSLALRRLRREAKPGDTALCQEPFGLRPGVLALSGPLPGDDVLVLRDGAGGAVEAVTCPAGSGEAPTPPGVEPPAAVEYPPAQPPVVKTEPDHWWFTGPGIGLVVAGGVMVGLGVQQHFVATTERDRAKEVEDNGDAASKEIYDSLHLAEKNSALFLGIGGALTGVGIAACITGIVLAQEDDEPGDGPTVGVGLGSATLTWRFD